MKKLVVLFLIIIGTAYASSASYISLRTTVDTKVDKNILKVMVSAVNKGDEAAHNVQAELRVGDKKFLAQKRQELRVDATYKAMADFKLDLKRPGQYPLIIVLHYTDANQYPFSALSVPTFIYKEERAGELFSQLSSAKFTQNGAVRLVLKNMGENEVRAISQLVVPRELTAEKSRVEALLSPRSKKRLYFEVENFSALAGSSYQVFAITEYEREGIHYTVVSPGTVSIVEKNFFRDYQLYIFGLIIILLAIFIFLQFKKA